MSEPRQSRRDRGHRLLAVLALVVAGALAGLIVATSGSRSESTAATSTPTPTPTTPPAIPCPGTSGSKTTGSKATSTSTSAQGATWIGVFERVTAHLDPSGAVKRTPRQFTRVSVEGDAPVTVSVPMSSSRLRKRSKGKKPSFSNGMAQIQLDPNGTSTQQLDSEFTGPLPVEVKVSYKLNGEPVSERDLKRKSGTVEVEYQLTNTTPKPVTVCFKGFNGQLTKQTVQTPVPIIAHLSLTVPKSATTFHAPGAALSPARKGVDVGWTVAMFQPLGPTTKTFQLAMTTSKAQIPESHVLIETLDPVSLTGAAPAKSAAAVGQAAAAAQSAAAKVESDVAALQLKAGQPKQPRRSRGSSGRSAGRSRSKQPTRLSFGTPTSALTEMQAQFGTLAQANRTFIANLNGPTGKLLASTRRSIDDLAGATSRVVERSTRHADRSIDRMTASFGRSLVGLKVSTAKAVKTLAADLRRATDTSALNALTAAAVRLQAASLDISHRVDAVNAAVGGLAAGIDPIIVRLPVQDAGLVVERLARIKADLDLLSAAQRSDPAIVKLASDLADAQAAAGSLTAALGDVQDRLLAIAAQVRALEVDLVALQTQATALAAAALANAENTIQGSLTTAVAGLADRFATAAATAAGDAGSALAETEHQVSTAERNAKRSVASAGTDAKHSVASAQTEAQRSLDSSVSSAKRSIRAAQRRTDQTFATVQQQAARALAAAKQKAKQGGQAALASAQSASAQAAAAVGQALAIANKDYARLLTTNELATANQLPGGDVSGATEQNGSFRYVIAGS